MPAPADVVESSFQQRLCGTPLCFIDEGREPSPVFTSTCQLGGRRSEGLGIAELEVRAGEDAQALCGCPSRASTGAPAQCDELFAEPAALAGLGGRLETGRPR